jgi:hypothetical protein
VGRYYTDQVRAHGVNDLEHPPFHGLTGADDPFFSALGFRAVDQYPDSECFLHFGSGNVMSGDMGRIVFISFEDPLFHSYIVRTL